MDRNARPLALSWAVSVSLSARRAWIEIAKIVFVLLVNGVALRKESVDRNGYLKLLATLIPEVALRKESVDRNRASTTIITICIVSLSARRAWIEITLVQIITSGYASRSPQGERG